MKEFKFLVFTLMSFMLFGIVNVNAEEYEAKIGSRNYLKLEEAIFAAKAEDEIVILKDIDLTESYTTDNKVYVPFADNVTVNLNGFSVKSNNNSIRYLGNGLTIKNGKFIVNGFGSEKEGSYSLFLGHNSQSTSGYILEDLVLEGGLNVFNATDVVLKNVTATGTDYYAVWADNNAEIYIKSGNYSSKSGVILNSADNGLIIVEGGTFDDFIYGHFIGAGAEITVKLNEDMNLNGVMDIAGNITIDLNGHNIIQKATKENVFIVQGGNVNFVGNGKIISAAGATNAIRILGSAIRDDKNYTTVTIGKDVTVESDGYAAYISTVENKAYGVNVNIYGTLKGGYNGFYVNGTINDPDGNFTNFPVVNVYDGAVVEGIYAGGYATWNIGAATIKDSEFGIGIKAGKFIINKAVISATGEKFEPSGNGNGINHTGAALQFETNEKYADNIEVLIKDATVSSKNGYAILEYLGQTEILDLNIEGGKFTSASGLDVFSVSDNFGLTKFIKGGTYSSDVRNYIATGLVSKKVGDVYVVGTERTVNVGTVTGGKVQIDITKAVVGETVTVSLDANDGYELSELIVLDANDNEIEVIDNKFIMPDSNVQVSAKFTKIEHVTEIPVMGENSDFGVKEATKVEEILLETLNSSNDANIKEALKDTSIKVEVLAENLEVSEKVEADFEKVIETELKDAKLLNYWDISIVVKNVLNDEKIATLPELTKEIELVVQVPNNLEKVKEGYNRIFYIIREHNGKIEVIKDVKLSEDGKFLSFNSKEFSTYALAYKDVETSTSVEPAPSIPEVPKTGDNVIMFMTLGFISIACIGILFNNLKKRSVR